MKTKRVVAGIIREENKIFATQRGHGEFNGYWEFPGGKIEFGETPEEALEREMEEELATKVEVGELVQMVEYDYPDFHLSMYCYLCSVIEGDLQLIEHLDAKWLSAETINSVNWLPADMDLIERLKKEYL